jgi:hypothetical protein
MKMRSLLQPMRKVLYLHSLSSVLFHIGLHDLTGIHCISAFKDFLPLSAVLILERNRVKEIRRIKINELKNIIREMEQRTAGPALSWTLPG